MSFTFEFSSIFLFNFFRIIQLFENIKINLFIFFTSQPTIPTTNGVG